jgi:hypothetical protein
VSITKFLLLSIGTLGLYEIYWFYKNWGFIKARDRSDISPAWRSLFGILFCYRLLRRVSDDAVARGGRPLPAGWLAAGWVITTLLARLPDPYWLVTFSAVLFLLPVQARINSLNAQAAPGHDPNARFSGTNILGLVVGGLIFALGLLGTLLPPDPS